MDLLPQDARLDPGRPARAERRREVDVARPRRSDLRGDLSAHRSLAAAPATPLSERQGDLSSPGHPLAGYPDERAGIRHRLPDLGSRRRGSPPGDPAVRHPHQRTAGPGVPPAVLAVGALAPPRAVLWAGRVDDRPDEHAAQQLYRPDASIT